MGEVHKLELVSCGEGYRFNSEDILEAAKGRAFHRLCIIGQLEDGEMYIEGTANAGETLILLKRAENFIVEGD